MNIVVTFIIIAVLVFISYQLYLLNKSRVRREEDEKINERMPNLYKKSAPEELKKDIRDFIYNPPSFGYYAVLKTIIEKEENQTRKEKMQKVKEKLDQVMSVFRKLLENSIATDDEKHYVQFKYYEMVYRNFPDVEINEDPYTELDDFMVFNGYKNTLFK